MHVVATRVDDADAHAATGETPGSRIDAHHALSPALQALRGEIGIELGERAQPDGVDAGAEARGADQTVPVIRGGPDEDRLDRVDGAAEEVEARGAALVSE